MPVKIDPATGERVEDVQIDPNTGERMSASPAATRTIPTGIGQKLLGVNPVSDTLSSVGSHLANMVTGPFHAFTDDPKNAEEQNIKGTDGSSGFAARALGQFGLGAARMLVQPTRNAIRDSTELRRLGGPQASLLRPSSYDDQGNNIPTAGSKLIDALPVIGPWSRAYADETAQKGLLPATAGLATDLAGPKLLSKASASLRGVAPSLAEGALKISAADRGYGKTIGRAILDDTTGIRPSSVMKSAQDKIAQLTPQVDAMAAAHPGPVSIQPALDSVGDTQVQAAKQNNVGSFNVLEPVRKQLTENYFGNNQPFAAPTVGSPNAAISPMQTATDALGLKRGLRKQFVKNFSLDSASSAAKDAAKAASGEIDQSLDRSLGPEFSRINQRISSLIPVEDAAEKLTRTADLGQSLGDKLGKHTGALTGAAAGAAAFGPLGGIAGFALPEMLSSPAARLALARTLNSRLPVSTLPLLTGGSILNPRDSK